MNTTPNPLKRVEILSLFGMGVLFLAIAVLSDPIGSNPDTGMFDLGSIGTKRLLGAFGIFFIFSGIFTLVKTKQSK